MADRTQAGGLHLESKPGFNVVLAYEDRRSGQRALRTVDALADRLRGVLEFSKSLWNFDALKLAALRDMAAEDAIGADMIIVSTGGQAELPTQVRTWIESWSTRASSKPRALVALFDEAQQGPETASLQGYLRKVAERGNMDFFSQSADKPLHSSMSPVARAKDKSSSPLLAPDPSTHGTAPYRFESPRWWGINE